MSKIKFELLDKYKEHPEFLPKRSTDGSAGYDLVSTEEIKIKPYSETKEVVMVPTGVKAIMPKGIYLFLANRSSNGVKRKIVNPNGIGVVDPDYYSTVEDKGHIMFPLINMGTKTYTVKVGDRIGQGIFQSYFLTDDDKKYEKTTRKGGFGSSGD